MPRFVLFCLFVLAGLGSAGCKRAGLSSDTQAAQSFKIIITCDGKNCSSNERVLESWPEKIMVENKDGKGTQWECTINGEDGYPCSRAFPGKVHHIQLKSEKGTIVLPFSPKHEEDDSGMLPVVGTGVVLLASFIAIPILYFVLKASDGNRRQAEALNALLTQAQSLDSTLRGSIERLRFPELPQPPSLSGYQPAGSVTSAGSQQTVSSSQQAVYSPQEAPPSNPEAQALRAEIRQFFQCTRDCFNALGRQLPADAADLERLAPQVGAQVAVQDARGLYQAKSRTIAQLALSATEDDYKRRPTQNVPAEQALVNLLKAGGFQILNPRKGDAYNDMLHHASHSERPDDPNLHGCVARVERRGLLNLNREIIKKAEVVIYD